MESEFSLFPAVYTKSIFRNCRVSKVMVILTRPARAHPEFRRLPANPGNKAAQLRMVPQLLDRVGPTLQFLFQERRMDRDMTDPAQCRGVPTAVTPRHEMMLVGRPL